MVGMSFVNPVLPISGENYSTVHVLSAVSD